MLQLRTNETLDGGDHGWLKARHHFAVSTNGNPANGSLGALVVWNDDEIAPGTGFGRHPHADMEIITYVRQGVVTHEDSAGNVGRTVAGDVQVISAGTGITLPSAILAPLPSSCFRFGCFLGSAVERHGGTTASSRRPIAPDD